MKARIIFMNKKDVLEIKRRFRKEACTFTRMCGCYVDADHNKITKIGETFLNLDDAEYFKYLDIAKKALSGTLGNNLLELDFPLEEEGTGGRQQFLMGLRESKLKNDDLLDTFYDMIIDSYDYVGNYLILIFHDAYDVMTKTSDNDKLDESEEVYEYLLCAICPVNLTKPGLGYREDENRIESRIRDWVVGMPDTGFIFPAFTDRSTDIHSVMFYTKDTRTPHREFMTAGLGCEEKQTSTEKKITFQKIINDVIGDDDDGHLAASDAVHNLLNDVLVENRNEDPDEEAIGVELTKDIVKNCLDEIGLDDKSRNVFIEACEEMLPEHTLVDEVVDEKAFARANRRKLVFEMKELLIAAANRLQDVYSDDSGLVEDIRKMV
jgi:hypothetical protein